MIHRALLLRPQIEQLEARENPSTVVFSEGFDTLVAPKLPTSWATWSNDGEQQFITTKLTNTSTPNSLASLGSSAVAARMWNTTPYTADFGAALNVRSDAASPIELIVRGQNLNTTTPSYIAALVRKGGTIELIEVNNGVTRSLGIVKPTQAPTNAAWLRVTILPVGNRVGVELQRLDTNAFLGADGKWGTLETQAVNAPVTLIPTTGLLGLGRETGASGMAYLDDFAVLAPPGINESFDATTPPAIPAGWSNWSSDGLPRSRVGIDKFTSGTRSLAFDGASNTLARLWSNLGLGADVQASATVFADSLISSGVIVRGSALQTATPTYYSLTVVRGLQVQLSKVINSTETILGTVKSTAWVSGAWIRLSLVAVGDKLKAVVYRTDKSQYLAANGAWVNTPDSALAITDATIKTGGSVGLTRNKSAYGTVWLDDFDARTPSVSSGPAVTILASQSIDPASKVVTFTALASPSSSVTRLEFILDGTSRSIQNTANGSWDLDTTTLTNGNHVLSVRALDTAGNSGTASVTLNVQNGVPVTATGRPDTVHHYMHIRIAMLAYAGNPAGTFEQNLAANSIDLMIPSPNLLNAYENAAPNTTKVIYTNVSNLYGDLLTDWNRYADANGLSRELAFYHISAATPFTGNSPSSFPVTYFWNASLGNIDGTGTPTDQTSSARGTKALAIRLGAVGQALTIGYPEKFRELNITVKTPPASAWNAVIEYASAVDAAGKPTAWKTLNLLNDGTAGFKTTGKITFDPPADWIAALPATGTQRFQLIRIRTTAGTAAQAPELQTILGRDYVQANGATTGTIPAFDTLADADKNGYLNDAEYAKRRSGFDARFTHESRLFYPFYGQMRFLTNPGAIAVRNWAADYHTRLLALNPKADGVFIDNAHGKLPFVAGTIQVNESVSNFTQDSAALVKAITLRLGDRWTVSNTAGSIAEADGIAGASTAAFEEFLLRPNDVNWSGFNDVASIVARRLASDTTSPYVILDTYSGKLPTSDERSRSGALAYYYLLADPNKTFISFFGGQQPAAAWSQSWVPAAAFNVGKPTGTFTTFASGLDPQNASLSYKVLARTYENALVLFKPRSYGLGKGGGTNDDATATTHALGGNFRLLRSDGTLGGIITSIALRNGEGATLIKA